ncbi:phosphate-binding protein PstS [Nakamurella endophytica]|uniref:Phosphate-binding protein n=1 Tax=Nakamurella endophytica TaxID=1748367 RepID=A0A917WN37_9ACTN|nr:phosphate-binding protein PstS [Nakamurella endophytica]
MASPSAATSSAASDTGSASGSGSSSASASGAGSSAATSGAASGGSGSSSATSGGGSATTFEGAGFTCATGELRSSGSTAQGKVIAQWITDYNAKCGASVNDYGGGGSGKGVSDFSANQTDFGGSDSALKDTETAAAKQRCGGNDAIDLPMVTGPIAVAYNLSGVDTLVLTPKVLVGIFGGQIKTWNDPQIAALNKGVTLPSDAIQTVHRSEDSGTTDNFTKYLTAAGGWTFEGGKAWTAPGGTGAQGSDGVAKAVQSTAGAIGYVEWGFAQSDKLPIAQIDNGAGAVELTAESAGKAVQAAKIVGTGKDLALKLDYATKEAGAYPIVLVTYEIVCSAGNGDKAALLQSFLGYAATDGQQSLADLGAAPLPASIQTKVVDAVKALS